MPDHRSLSLIDVADKLKIGETTLNLWRKRYKKWMPMSVDGEDRLFPEAIMDVFRFISKCIHAGMEPHEIECVLDSRTGLSRPEKVDDSQANKKPDKTQAILTALTETVSGMVGHQQRIADAQERRALAEERKAYAMESQAEAELLKANALRDMVTYFQGMTVNDPVSALMDKVKNMPVPSHAELEDFTGDLGYASDQFEDIPELTDLAEPESSEPEMLEPESELVADLEKIADIEPVDGDIRDLVSEEPLESFVDDDVDDLSLLIDEDAVTTSGEIVDDLSLLLEDGDDLAGEDMDDLSLLLETDDKVAPSSGKKDDVAPMDDLSALIEPEDLPKAPVKGSTQPAKVDETYKSKILKRIIQMKQQEKLSVEETTQRFNNEGVKTLSGKGQWDNKTIQGIYKYIDSVQGG